MLKELFIELGFSRTKANQLSKKYPTLESLLDAIQRGDETFTAEQMSLIENFQVPETYSGSEEESDGSQGDSSSDSSDSGVNSGETESSGGSATPVSSEPVTESDENVQIENKNERVSLYNTSSNSYYIYVQSVGYVNIKPYQKIDVFVSDLSDPSVAMLVGNSILIKV